MYSTCLFCKGKLGVNDVIESFPVGKRLAFDAAKGRLWVVCGRCGRWNLSPVEERWEAVEECERLFAGTPLRASTEQIGLARVAAGTELVRIGRPPRSEFAAWRYGNRFRSRHRRTAAFAGVVTAYGTASLIGGSTLALLTTGPVGLLLMGAVYSPLMFQALRVVARVTTEEKGQCLVRGVHAATAKLVPSDAAPGWRLQVPHSTGVAELDGPAALHVAGLIFAHRNVGGATQKQVGAAVTELERVDHPERYFAAAATRLGSRVLAPAVERERHSIAHLPYQASLALEMAANEGAERQALDGELRLLERAWREAEEIAAIADRLALPPGVDRLVARYRTSAAPREPIS